MHVWLMVHGRGVVCNGNRAWILHYLLRDYDYTINDTHQVDCITQNAKPSLVFIPCPYTHSIELTNFDVAKPANCTPASGTDNYQAGPAIPKQCLRS